LKQARITDRAFDASLKPAGDTVLPEKKKSRSSPLPDVDLSELKENVLWSVLVDTARRSPLYSGLTGYIKSEILPKYPKISARELASKLSISYGEALVFLADVRDK
jgi:hypothetical protein